MRKYCLQTHILTVLTIIVFLIPGYGQVKPALPKGSTDVLPTVTGSTPSLMKTQGSKQSDNIRCGLLDKAGNLWFGTTGEGVYRYDGKGFTQFTIKDGLNSNKIWSILEDRSGNIWLGTTDGICCYNGKKMVSVPVRESFMPAYNSGNNYYRDWSNANTVWSIFQDKSGKIWIGTGNGVYCYNGTSFIPFLDNKNVINPEGLHLKMVDCIIEDNSGIIWFASGMLPGEEGLCRYDGQSLTSTKPNGDSWIRGMVKDQNGNIWFAGRKYGNFVYNGKTFTNFTKKTGIGNVILSDKNGNIWFTGEENDNYENVGGIWCYNGKSFKNFTAKDGIGKYSVWSMTEDRKGNIWIGTRNTGLYQYNGKGFTRFSE